MKYYFGSEKNIHSSHMITIEAFNLEFAIKKFNLEACDYPEKYIEQDIFQQGENNYDYEQGIYKIDENKLKALKKITIPVFVKEDGAFKRISEVDEGKSCTDELERKFGANKWSKSDTKRLKVLHNNWKLAEELFLKGHQPK